jgi:hypothetical protein
MTLDEVIEDAKGQRERTADKDTMITMLYVERGGRDLAVLFVPGGRDEALRAMRLAFTGLEADAATAVIDAYVRLVLPDLEESPDLNPVTGEPWQEGDMQRMAEGGHRDLLGEELLILHARRGEAGTVREIPYYRRGDGTVKWEEEKPSEDSDGVIVEAMTEIPFVDGTSPRAQIVAEFAELGTTEAEAHAHLDVAALRHAPVVVGVPISGVFYPADESAVAIYAEATL